METSINYTIVSATNHTITDWDQYVENHSLASPYHRFAWVKSVNEAYGHDNVSLIAYEADKVVGVMPCIKMQRPFSKPLFCSLPFCDLGFCLADNETIKQALINQSLELFQSDGGINFEYRDSCESLDSENLVGNKVRMLLPLPENSEILMAGFKSKLRSQIRKAEKNGLTYLVDNNQKQIDDFYQIFSINMRKLGSPVHSKKWFESLIKHYADHIFLSVVYSEGNPVGAGIVLRNGSKISIPWASTVADYNRLAPNMMLYWSLLQYVCELGCTEFDFGRSTYDEGTYKFKRQWGAVPVPLVWSNLARSDNVDNHKTDENISKIRSVVEKTWSKLPLGVTTIIGPIIRKHISL
jgi:FemAB-related protein (PEP-CTERM system-associated)